MQANIESQSLEVKPNGGGNIPSKLENKIKQDFGGLKI